MKKCVFLIISVMFFFIMSTPVFAFDLDGCKVERVGTYPDLENVDLERSQTLVFLSHPTAWADLRFFSLSSKLGNAGLATILSAMALDKTVFVRIESEELLPGSIVSVVYANNW